MVFVRCCAAVPLWVGVASCPSSCVPPCLCCSTVSRGGGSNPSSTGPAPAVKATARNALMSFASQVRKGGRSGWGKGRVVVVRG